MADFRCPLRRTKGRIRVEWVQIGHQGGTPDAVDYEIPRPCMEAIGIDCTPLDRRDESGRQHTVWIRDDQAEQLHRHRHYLPVTR